MDLRERLAAWLAIRGLTRSALAKAAGVTPAAVTAWLHPDASKRSYPTQKNLDAVVARLGISMAEFYGAMPQPPAPSSPKSKRSRAAA